MMTLADAIISERIDLVTEALGYTQSVNQIDEYGFTPLIEAAIADNLEISALLLKQGAMTNLQDMTGNTALHWAAENNNLPLCQLLLSYRADPNAYNFAGQPVLVMPVLRQQSMLKKLLMDNGADLAFAQDFINAKTLGHMFELVGTANIVDPKNNYVEIDFEGFYLEVTLGLVGDSLAHYKNHFAARQMRRYSQLSQVMVQVIQRAAQLIKYQQYRVNTDKHAADITALIKQEPLLIPVGYEGHAITFVKFGNIFVKCDRREDSRLYDNIVIYQIGNPDRFTEDFTKKILYERLSHEYVNEWLPEILGLQPITEIKVSAQVSGNCSWANVEACIPILYFLLSSREPDFQNEIPRYKNMALKYFNQWREWNKDRALHFCIQSITEVDSIRRACKAEILAAILFQCCNDPDNTNNERIETILGVLLQQEFRYILQNYVQTYCYEDAGEEGRNFLRMLRAHGYTPQN